MKETDWQELGRIVAAHMAAGNAEGLPPDLPEAIQAASEGRVRPFSEIKARLNSGQLHRVPCDRCGAADWGLYPPKPEGQNGLCSDCAGREKRRRTGQ